MKKTKIICTLGPASSSEEMIEKMLRAGMDVARVNFSHGDHESHKKTIDTFRKVRDSIGMPAAVLLDTKGPEIRIGTFTDGSTTLVEGQTFTLCTDKNCPGCNEKIGITYDKLPEEIAIGQKILVDDGKIELTVTEVRECEIVCKVITGGKLTNRKGINVPNVHLSMPFLSQRDKDDLKFGVELDVDFVAASFVRSADDVIAIRNFLDFHGGHNIRIIAKIENSEGVDNFDSILDVSDGIMVARGDMGVEIEYEKLPGLQKKFIKKCYSAGKMVITATQMLESMIHNTTPTRAEITDVANAVFDGTSAIMLSGETAMGDHPDLVVRSMAKIALQAERDAFEMGIYNNSDYLNDVEDTTNAICDAACTTAKDVNASAIIAITKSGYTARRVSKFRPLVPIIAPTPDTKSYHQLALSWGVYPVPALFQNDTNFLFSHAIACAKMHGMVKSGDRVVITGGTEGYTDVLKVAVVPEMKK